MKVFRGSLVAALVLGWAVGSWGQGAMGFRVEEATIAEMLDAVRTHKVTCRQLTEQYLARIAALDQKSFGPSGPGAGAR